MAVTFPLDAFAVLPDAGPAVVTPLGGAPVTTIVQWFQDEAALPEHQVSSSAASVASRRLVAWVRRDAVPTLPLGSTIVGGPAHRQQTWRVHAMDISDGDFHRATVV